MILQEVEPATGLPKVQETRSVAVADPGRRGCTCPQLQCLWKELPRDPWQTVLHGLAPGWTPQYQTFVDGSAQSVLCWKCGRAIKGYLPKLTRFGKPVEVADMILYLASSASDLVNGQDMLIDGGYTAV